MLIVAPNDNWSFVIFFRINFVVGINAGSEMAVNNTMRLITIIQPWLDEKHEFLWALYNLG